MKIEIEIGLGEGDPNNTMTEQDWQSLSGRRVVGVGLCEKHGTAVLVLSDDNAPHSQDIYQNMVCLADGMKEVLQGITRRARAKGAL